MSFGCRITPGDRSATEGMLEAGVIDVQSIHEVFSPTMRHSGYKRVTESVLF